MLARVRNAANLIRVSSLHSGHRRGQDHAKKETSGSSGCGRTSPRGNPGATSGVGSKTTAVSIPEPFNGQGGLGHYKLKDVTRKRLRAWKKLGRAMAGGANGAIGAMLDRFYLSYRDRRYVPSQIDTCSRASSSAEGRGKASC